MTKHFQFDGAGFTRRHVVGAALAVAAGSALAQESRSRAVRLMVSSAPGGGVDFTARLIAPRLGQEIGANVVVENKPGATGLICAQYVARSQPDGLTLMIAGGSAVTVAPHLVDRQMLDPMEDLIPINTVGTSPLCISMNPKAGVRNLAEFIAAAKSKPLTIAHPGVGTVSHLSMELLNQAIGGQLTLVAYKGGGPAMADALAGHVDGIVTDIPPVLPLVKERRMLPIAVTTQERFNLLPEVPPLSEAVPGYSVGSWIAVYAPAKTPQPIVDRLDAALKQIVANAEVAAQLNGSGVIVGAQASPTVFRRFVREEYQRWGELIKSKGITAS